MRRSNISDDPFFKYSLEEKLKMSEAEFMSLIEESNEYVRNRQDTLLEEPRPKFNNLEEALEYYNAVTFDDAMNYLSKLFENIWKRYSQRL